jgi:glycyl-tRNA synthetase beta chain
MANRTSASTQPFLVEIGTEELPPKSLRHLAEAFHYAIQGGLEDSKLLQPTESVVTGNRYFSPRRLAVQINKVLVRQPDITENRLGPAIRTAFDQDGKPTQAAEGFARSCGVTVSQLQRRQTETGERLAYTLKIKGKTAAELLPQIVSKALAKLPIPKRMRWGSGDAEFVRPVHWVVMLLGERPLKAEILGVTAGNKTYGHRYHHPAAITLKHPENYRKTLASTGKVLVEVLSGTEDRGGPLARKITAQVDAAAKKAGGQAQLDAALLEEVAAMVEWPVPVTGGFDEKFLALPDEVIVAVLETQQRYFPLRDVKGRLLPRFVAISNIQSKQPAEVRRGNERVIVPRLTDAMFFWDSDRKTRLETRLPELDRVVFQKDLGSYGDKSRRVAQLAARHIAPYVGADPESAKRAAQLSKCDLITSMVGEFPELQGIMGSYYARHDGEPEEVARAIAEQYLPRFSGDYLPESRTGMTLALAEKLDTICGIFAIGQAPTGEKDPFGLRRATLGVLRILIEEKLTLNLLPVLKGAVNAQPVRGRDADADHLFAYEVFEFIQDRLRGYLLGKKVAPAIFESVRAVRRLDGEPIDSPLDFVARTTAIRKFMDGPAAVSLTASFKRIRNILRQAKETLTEGFSNQEFSHEAESELGRIAGELDEKLREFVQRQQYDNALLALADLKDPLERFFNEIMVMTDDPIKRKNRLGLLQRLYSLCQRVADISCLPG